MGLRYILNRKDWWEGSEVGMLLEGMVLAVLRGGKMYKRGIFCTFHKMSSARYGNLKKPGNQKILPFRFYNAI